jgi:hypothetical protein
MVKMAENIQKTTYKIWFTLKENMVCEKQIGAAKI